MKMLSNTLFSRLLVERLLLYGHERNNDALKPRSVRDEITRTFWVSRTLFIIFNSTRAIVCSRYSTAYYITFNLSDFHPSRNPSAARLHFNLPNFFSLLYRVVISVRLFDYRQVANTTANHRTAFIFNYSISLRLIINFFEYTFNCSKNT